MTINSISQFRAIVRNGPYAWPGGYPMYFILADGSPVSFKALQKREILRDMLEALRDKGDGDWGNMYLPVAVEINWEDPDLFCDLTGERIESAYAEPE